MSDLLEPITHNDFSFLTGNTEMPHVGRFSRSKVGKNSVFVDSSQMVVCMPPSYCWIYAICSFLKNNSD